MPSTSTRPLVSDARALTSLRVEADLEELVAGYVPPARFANASFDTYLPRPAYPSQSAAVSRLRRLARDLVARPPGLLRRLRALFPSRRSDEPLGLYLDGGFGVGKTHLLAAIYHAVKVPRVYLSFAELAQTIITVGLPTAVARFRRHRLICVDEFELDDVASTRMAAAFLRGLWADGGDSRVVVTSNTLPSDLGRGRFSAADFSREIGEISAAFEVVRIEGEDYRHRAIGEPSGASVLFLPRNELDARFDAYVPLAGEKVRTSHDDLLGFISTLHPIHYGKLAESIEALFVDGVRPIPDQDAALRFVHLVDKLYDRRVRLFASSAVCLPEVFPAEYRHGGYSRKYGRCLSRLHELLAESAG